MEIQDVPIADVRPYHANPRKIPDRAVETVMESIRQYGWRQPIVVDKDMVVIAGHARLLAAQAMELAEVPVHVAEDLTEAQVRAYRLVDNRAGELSDWDIEILAGEISALDDLPPGWSEEEAELLEAAFLNTGENEPPPPESEPGIAGGEEDGEGLPEGYVVIRCAVPRDIANDVRDRVHVMVETYEKRKAEGA